MTKSSQFIKKKKGAKAPVHTGNANESSRIRVVQLLENFRDSIDRAYTFDSSMNSFERAMVHQHCRKMGMVSRSSGLGNKRSVTVYKDKDKKKKKSDHLERKDSVITFSEEAKRVLFDLFTHYPPGEDELSKQNLNEPSDSTPKSRSRRDTIFLRPIMDKAEIAKKVDMLTSRISNLPKLKKISEDKAKLPIAAFQDVITSTIATHQVVLISGETGCGKTTQVPQFLLDYMWSRGKACKIICTQPRRISAMSVAERISHERGEAIGETVGYKIRLDTKGDRQSSILFCTNGVMLRVLVSKGSSGKSGSINLQEFSHIIVDEIHERDRYSDFMLTILRDLLPIYPHFRLVLMSATLDAERFSQYFGGCPIIRVPGFTHPVKTFYLEEVVSIVREPGKNYLNSTSFSCHTEDCSLSVETSAALDEAIEMANSNKEFDPLLESICSNGTPNFLNYQHSLTGVTPLMIFAANGRVSDISTLLSLGADCHVQALDGSTALDWAKRKDQPEAEEIIMKHMVDSSSSSIKAHKLVENYMSSLNPELIDIVLIEQLLRKICMESESGAILVFLPGWEDINKTRERLSANPFYQDSSKFLILSLHSMVPGAEQNKVFKRPPPGCRKIILSTNIAESAITIDDVVYVIDSGRMKEKNYDPYSNVSTLHSSWTSQASAKQREGRAGRCQPGVCYHLYSKIRFASLPEFQLPEIKRMPIEELCLQVKMLDPNCKIEEFLKKTLDPPIAQTIKNALSVLQEIGALSHDERLTELGKKLGSLPVHPLIGSMLFFATLLNCLDPALTLACAADYREPFILPMLPNEKKLADAAKAELASLYGGHSDQLAIVAAFDCWRSAKDKGQELRFCSEYFISSSIMRMLSGMRKQLENELIRTGCIPDDISSCSMNAREPGIIRAVIVAGLYPMVGRLCPPLKREKKFIVEMASGEKVHLHPYSINSKLSIKESDDRPLLVYDEVTRGDMGMHTRNCTIIGPLPLLLLANEIYVAPAAGRDNASDDDGSGSDPAGNDELEGLDKKNKQGEMVMSSPDNDVTVIVDRWLSFKSTALEVAQIYCLRERLSAAILFKITNPKKVLPPVLGTSVYAIACLLAYDGMMGISLFQKSVDTLTSMVNNTEIGNSSAGKEESKNSFLISLTNHRVHSSLSSSHETSMQHANRKRRRGGSAK